MHKLFLSLLLNSAGWPVLTPQPREIVAVAEPSISALVIAGIISLTALAIFLRKKFG